MVPAEETSGTFPMVVVDASHVILLARESAASWTSAGRAVVPTREQRVDWRGWTGTARLRGAEMARPK